MKPSPSMLALQREHRACAACAKAGFIPAANPVVSSYSEQQIMLVGQAPGKTEHEVTRPFAGRAGKELVRWMLRAGFPSEEEFREQVFMTSMTTCFPGPSMHGGGDRKPSTAEIQLCAHWLSGYLRLLQPRLLITVGTLALHRFLPQQSLKSAVGNAWLGEIPLRGDPTSAPVIWPLPHPSGQSRWLNVTENRHALNAALERLAVLRKWALERV